jgi:hypothetical protein
MANQPNYRSETLMLRRVANDARCRWEFRKHALKELAKDGRTAADVQYAIMTNSQVTLHELKRDLLWRAEGKDLDGKRIQVVVAVFDAVPKIKVITAF